MLVDFTRGVMDRVRERCRELDPEGWAEADALPLIGDHSAWTGKRHQYKSEAERRHRDVRAKQMRDLGRRKLPAKYGLPLAPFLSSYQQLKTFKEAHRCFSRAEDREDFVQEVYALAWKSWADGGFKQFGADFRPDIYKLDVLHHTARHQVFGRRRTEVVLDAAEDDEESSSPFKTVMDQAFGDLLDQVPSKNPKVASQHRAWRFLLMPDESPVRFTYDELEELTGMTRSSLGRTRNLDRPVDLYHYNGRLYGRLVDIERKFNLSPAAARHRSRRVRLLWDEPSQRQAAIEVELFKEGAS